MLNIIKINPWSGTLDNVFERTQIEEGLEAKQKVVKGDIQLLTFLIDGTEYDFYFNEEGKFIDECKECMALLHEGKLWDIIMGNIIVTKANDDGEDIGLTEEDMNKIEAFFNKTFVQLTSKEVDIGLLVLPSYSFDN